MKKQLLYLFFGICLLQVANIGGLRAQTVKFDATWGRSTNYIFSELDDIIIPYGFIMTVSGAPVGGINITKFRINTSINTIGMFDLTTPNRISKFFKVGAADATLATATSPSIGAVTLHDSIQLDPVDHIEIALDAANQNYTNGTYYFYLGLYVNLSTFVGVKNAIRPINELRFSMPLNPYIGDAATTSVSQLPPVNPTIFTPQVSIYNLGIIYQWKGSVSGEWENKDNWLYRNEDDINAGIPAGFIPDTWDRCYFGEVDFINQPVVNASDTTGSLFFWPKSGKKIELTVIANKTFTLRQNIYQEYFTEAAGSSVLQGDGTIIVKNTIQVGDPKTVPFSPKINNLTSLISTVKTLTVGNKVIFYSGNGHTSEFILQSGNMTITYGIETNNTNVSDSYSKFGIIPITPSTATLTFYHPTPLDKITEVVGGRSVVRSGGLSAGGQNLMDFNHANSTVKFSAFITAGYPATNIYADKFIPNTTLSYYNLDLQGTSIKQSSPGILQISGNLGVTSGTLDVITNNTQLEFNGDAAQNITDFNSNGGNGVVFKNVSFSGSGIKKLAKSSSSDGKFLIIPTGVLTMKGSATLAAATNLLTLKSNATGSASVAAIPSTATITGNVNVERWLTGGSTAYRGYRLLSSPVNSGGFTNGTGNIDMRYIGESALTAGPGGAANGFNVANNNPTMYVYQETETAPDNTTFNSGKYKGILKIYGLPAPGGNVDIFNKDNLFNNKSIPVGNGYLFFYVGSNLSSVTAPTRIPDNVALIATGTVNQGDVKVKIWSTPGAGFNLSYTPGAGTTAGFNMVGNPYASTIDLNRVVDDNPKITGNIWQSFKTNYITYNRAGGSAPENPQYIVSGQGFIVQARDNNSTITFKESHKVPTQQLTGPALLMGTPVTTNVITGFYMKLEQDSVVNDYCGIYFRNDWTENFDQDDAIDLDGTSPKVYMSSFSADGVRTAINRYPDYTQRRPIKLYVSAVAGGDYKLKIEGIRNIDPAFDIWLKDHYLKDSVNIRETKSYAFTINKNVAASFGGERFELFAKRRELPAYKLISFSGEQVAEGVQLTWKTENEGDYTQFVLEKADGSQQFIPLQNLRSDGNGNYSFIDKMPATGNNAYRLKQIDPQKQETFSAVININYQTSKPLNARFTIYPNPAVNVITVTLIETPLNNLSMNVIDSKGNILAVKSINGKETQHQVGQLPPGTYLVKLMDIKLQKVIAIGKFVKL